MRWKQSRLDAPLVNRIGASGVAASGARRDESLDNPRARRAQIALNPVGRFVAIEPDGPADGSGGFIPWRRKECVKTEMAGSGLARRLQDLFAPGAATKFICECACYGAKYPRVVGGQMAEVGVPRELFAAILNHFQRFGVLPPAGAAWPIRTQVGDPEWIDCAFLRV